MLTRKRTTITAAAVTALAVLTLAGCSGSGNSGQKSSSMKDSKPSATATANPAADLVGPGCAAYAKQVPSGAGSIKGMSQDPVAVAASNNPMLTTLVKAVSGKLNPDVNLIDTLDGGQFTVFAPVDTAFAKLDPATVATLGTPGGADTLKTVLTYHVVPGQIAPDAIDGTHTTVEGQDLTVTGSGDAMKVNDANVVCGGVHTANATVYLIDAVLMPPTK
ncbi:fasciclin domain-containing protein [Planctomonas sp. JC2975]|uniref:fasciclin domain-containing protein n=1 Tax=Planctomonas sp. JC2975 TaxID=2729626 RepID=UPI0014749592|nr:fasciclin domain-containing protein [Planctomonas sp. JC2975]NNC11583.1 fasciclin domain-containing protein [Planctomonas sp. JC2975]